MSAQPFQLPGPPTNPNELALASFNRERFTGITGTALTLQNICVTGTELVFVNGALLDPNPVTAYFINGTSLTLQAALISTDVLVISYYFRPGV